MLSDIKSSYFAMAAVLVVAGACFGEGTPATPTKGAVTPAGPPAYTPVRWNEDYSYLKNASKSGDLFDPIKYISLSERNDSYLTLGGQLRDSQLKQDYRNESSHRVVPRYRVRSTEYSAQTLDPHSVASPRKGGQLLAASTSP